MKLLKSNSKFNQKMIAEMDEDAVDSINIEADKDYVKRTLPGSVVIFLLLIIAGLISNVLDDSPFFYLTIIFVSICNIVAHIILLKILHSKSHGSIERWEAAFSTVALSTALTWGLFSGWSLIQYGISDITLVYLLFSVGIGSGAAASNFIWKSVAQTYLTIVLLPPVVILMIFESGSLAWALSSSFMIYFLFLYLQVVRANNEYWRALINTRLLSIQAQELRKAQQMKSEFLSVMSHELRTPLTSIRGALGILASDELKLPQEEVDKMINIAHENSNHLSFLVNDILDFEKLESGNMLFDKEYVQLSALIRYSVAATQSYADEYEVGFMIADNCCADLTVYVDQHRLQQVMSNLLSNAVKYSQKGGVVEIQSSVSGSRVRVSVIDHGKGVPKGFYDAIFTHFSQADITDSREKRGTGLGLAIAKEIIERHDGCIGFDSEEGKGSRFYFELEIVQPDTE